jgi:hypothetical protein
VRRHPKASPAGPNSYNGHARFGGGFATRGASGSSCGSGASASRTRLAFLGLSLAALVLVLAPGAQAKVVVNGFGTQGTLGGQFGTAPRGVTVNNTGNGGVAAGTVYVVDGNQNRVQRFSPGGSFERTWGQNVSGRDEKQLVTVSNATGGTFTLTFGANTTGPISFNADPNTVQTALTGLASIGANNATVSSPGSPPTDRA